MKDLIVPFIFIFFALNMNAQKDCNDCNDYSFLPRMPNYHITVDKVFEFDSEKFYINKQATMIEGKKIKLEYTHNNRDDDNQIFPSRLQILRNYSNAIEKAGGKILLERKSADHGYYTFNDENGKEIWVKLRTAHSGKKYYLIIIERELMKQEIEIDANLIKNKIDLYGKIAIYGIHFDVGKSDIKTSSKITIKEISTYLKENPTVKLWVVGHTDSDGSFELNSKLSLDRSKAIKKELEENYNISEGRLFAEGVGPLAPVATNKTEEGKEKNRRVEFVLK